MQVIPQCRPLLESGLRPGVFFSTLGRKLVKYFKETGGLGLALLLLLRRLGRNSTVKALFILHFQFLNRRVLIRSLEELECSIHLVPDIAELVVDSLRRLPLRPHVSFGHQLQLIIPGRRVIDLASGLGVKTTAVESNPHPDLEEVPILPVRAELESDISLNLHSAFLSNRGPIMAQF